ILLDVAYHDLEDALHVLALGDRARDVVEQTHAVQLRLEAALADLATRVLGCQRIDARRALLDLTLQVAMAPAQLLAELAGAHQLGDVLDPMQDVEQLAVR